MSEQQQIVHGGAVNVTGETLVVKKVFFPAFCWENPCLMLGKKTLFYQLCQFNAGMILAVWWANSCLAPDFHQSRFQLGAVM